MGKKKPSSIFKKMKMTKKERQEIKQAEFIVPGLIISGMLINVVAKESSGKTLVAMKGWAEQMAKKGFEVVYFDADGNPEAAIDFSKLAEKSKYSDRITYIPLNQKQIYPEEILSTFSGSITEQEDLSKKVFIFDTVKKFVEMLSKNKLKEFYQLQKMLTALGSTIINIGHCNKHFEKDGKLIFEGTNEVATECDCLIYAYYDKNIKLDKQTIAFYPADKFRGIPQRVSYSWKISDRFNTFKKENKFIDVFAEQRMKTGKKKPSILVVPSIKQICENGLKRPMNKTNLLEFLRAKTKNKGFSHSEIKGALAVLENEGFFKIEKGNTNNALFYSVVLKK